MPSTSQKKGETKQTGKCMPKDNKQQRFPIRVKRRTGDANMKEDNGTRKELVCVWMSGLSVVSPWKRISSSSLRVQLLVLVCACLWRSEAIVSIQNYYLLHLSIPALLPVTQPSPYNWHVVLWSEQRRIVTWTRGRCTTTFPFCTPLPMRPRHITNEGGLLRLHILPPPLLVSLLLRLFAFRLFHLCISRVLYNLILLSTIFFTPNCIRGYN